MRFVFDLDDTISVHKNRDFVNAKPIDATIDKIRTLKAGGAEIIIYSARGQNSCRGDLQLIEERNRTQVETWLTEHNVPCDRLVFGKPLGDVYVDDKGISLTEFLQGEYSKLDGNSGAEVYRAGDKVLKRSADAQQAADWYAEARAIGLNVPKTNSVVVNTLDIEYLDGEPGNQRKLSHGDLSQIVSQIMLMKLHRSAEPFDTDGYTEFILQRLAIAGWQDDFPVLLGYIRDKAESIRRESSFGHGDLSLSNVIFVGQAVYLIDPSPRKAFSTYLMDFAKLMFSLDGGEQLLHGGARPEEYDARLVELEQMLGDNGWLDTVRAMEAVHWIRMLGYFTDRETIREKAKAAEAQL